jgi:hypothetical protein
MDHRNWLKASVAYSKLPDLQKTVRRLETRIAVLESVVKSSS